MHLSEHEQKFKTRNCEGSHFSEKKEAPSSRIGFCVVGLLRTFALQSIRDQTLAWMQSISGANTMETFFVLTLQDKQTNSYFGAKSLSFTELPHEVKKDFKRFNMKSAAIFSSDSSRKVENLGWQWSELQGKLSSLNTTCSVKVEPWIDKQFIKHEICASMIDSYEEFTTRSYDYVVRIRPDLMFVNPKRQPSIDTLNLKYGDVLLPSKLWLPGPNDHFAICRGSAKDCVMAFSQHAMFRSCQGSTPFASTQDPRKQMPTWFGHYLHIMCYRIKEYPFEYAVFRNCPVGSHGDKQVGCQMLKMIDRHNKLIQKCKVESQALCAVNRTVSP